MASVSRCIFCAVAALDCKAMVTLAVDRMPALLADPKLAEKLACCPSCEHTIRVV